MNFNTRGMGLKFKRKVFYTGADALKRGEGLCYNADSGTATENDEARNTDVERPSTSNNLNFAGVTAEAYAANAQGQEITIYEPGSVCDIRADVAMTVNSGRLTCMVNGDQSAFGRGGLPGRGSAIPLQTTPTASTTSSNGPISSSLDGTASFVVSTKTLTKTGLFTNAAVGDKVICLGAAVAATSLTPVTAGVATIATRTSADVAVLDDDFDGTAATTVVGAFLVVRGDGTFLAYLEDGPESGLAQWHTPLTSGTTAPMNGGTTFINGGLTLAADDAGTLAAATQIGVRKFFECMGTLTTSDYQPTVVGKKSSNASASAVEEALGSLEFDAAGECALLEWTGTGSAWKCITTTAVQA